MPIYKASVLLLSVFSTYGFNRSCFFFWCCYTKKIHTAAVMVLTTTSISKVCAPITTAGVLKIWHWNNIYAHSWKIGCLGICQYLTSPVCKSQHFAKVHIMYVIRCTLRIMIERGSSSRTADLHLCSKTFQFWLRYRLPWLWLFLSPSGKCWDTTLNSTRAPPFYTLSHSHHCHPLSSHCIICITGSIVKWAACKCTQNNEHIL